MADLKSLFLIRTQFGRVNGRFNGFSGIIGGKEIKTV